VRAQGHVDNINLLPPLKMEEFARAAIHPVRFERETFDADTGSGGFEIWVPIKV
jgi:hypothetical protein